MAASFRVFGEPKGQPRVRRSKSGGVYTPDSAEGFKSAIQYAAMLPSGIFNRNLSGPIRVDTCLYFPRPKRIKGREWHTSKPDRDNVDKVILDALTQIGAWGDDAQVCAGATEKWYCAENEEPGAQINIYTWKEPT